MKKIVIGTVAGLIFIALLAIGLPSLQKVIAKAKGKVSQTEELEEVGKLAVEGKEEDESVPIEELEAPGETEITEKQIVEPKEQKPVKEQFEGIMPVQLIKTFFENGALSSEWKFVDGEPDGPAKFYDESGKLRSEINFKYGVREGFSRIFYENGTLWMEETFAGDHREGIKHIYYPSGALWMEEDYSKGRLRADPKVYSENGDLMLAVDINPEEKGVFKVYSPTGELKNEWSYQDGKKASISKTYAKDGSVSSEWQFSEGRPDGPVKFYLAKDKLGMEMNFKKGVKEGPVKIYYPSSGALWIQAALHQDEEQGTLWVHYPRGAVLMESDFEAGQMSGPPRLHHESEWVQPAVVQQVLEGEVPANQS